MRASLNLRPCDPPEGLETFDDLVAWVERSQLPGGHVLTRILLDGAELDEQGEVDAAPRPLSGIGMVEFHSARTLDLARDGLEDALDLLPALCEDLAETAGELRAGDPRVGLEMLYECTGILDWYVSLLSAIDQLYIRAGQPLDDYEGDGAAEGGLGAAEGLRNFDGAADDHGLRGLQSFSSIENFRRKLIEIEAAESKQDLLLLADLLEYELAPLVKLWERELPALRARMQLEGGEA